MLVVPIETGLPNQEMTLILDGVSFILRFFWNDRDESWYWELFNSAREPLWCGQRIATGSPLLRQCVASGRPAGELVAIDTRGKDLDPTLEDFGEDGLVKLIYATAAELAAALAEAE